MKNSLKNDLEFLERIHGRESVPGLLGVSCRHYRRIRTTGRATATIEHLVRLLVKEAQQRISQVYGSQQVAEH